jgi:hypothetical protein
LWYCQNCKTLHAPAAQNVCFVCGNSLIIATIDAVPEPPAAKAEPPEADWPEIVAVLTEHITALEAQNRALRGHLAVLLPLARRNHEAAIGAHPLFSVDHWKHNAGIDWPQEPDDNSYEAFENCQHPICRAALATPGIAPATPTEQPAR